MVGVRVLLEAIDPSLFFHPDTLLDVVRMVGRREARLLRLLGRKEALLRLCDFKELQEAGLACRFLAVGYFHISLTT